MSAFSMVPEPTVPVPPKASNSMSSAFPFAVMANAKCDVPPPIFKVIMPLWSEPIEYVPVKGCVVRTSPPLTPLLSSSPLVKFPAPSAVNLPTTAKTVEVPPLPLNPLNVNA